MSSSYVEYDPALFVLERQAGSSTSWVPLPVASFSWTMDYDPDDNGTLIFQRETATLSISYWTAPTSPPLYAVDRVRAKYDGQYFFLGIVESTSTEYEVDKDAADRGKQLRVNFSASLVGKYAAALERSVCWTPPGGAAPTAPADDTAGGAHDFITQWITVQDW